MKQLQQDMEQAINFKPIDPMNPMGKKMQNKSRIMKPTNPLSASQSIMSATPPNNVILY